MKMQTGGGRQQLARFAGAVLTATLCVAGFAQISLGGEAVKKGHVASLTDSADIEAGKPQVVEFRFRIDDGFHINSHTPKDELLIPTALKLDAGSISVLGVDYPKGAEFKLSGSGEALDVYQGEFRVKVKVTAPKGAWTLAGNLHYQACDNASCLPPRNVAVKAAVTAK
jgi:hypothetical protein